MHSFKVRKGVELAWAGAIALTVGAAHAETLEGSVTEAFGRAVAVAGPAVLVGAPGVFDSGVREFAAVFFGEASVTVSVDPVDPPVVIPATGPAFLLLLALALLAAGMGMQRPRD